MSVGTLMAGKRVCICTGSGGVGKTTTAAAVALGLAARGQRVAVLEVVGLGRCSARVWGASARLCLRWLR